MKTAEDNYSAYSDEKVATLDDQDQRAFSELIERYEKKLFRYIGRISDISHEDIEDVLQEIFIKAYQHILNFDTDQKFSSWIYRIAHNETINYYRKQHVRPEGHKASEETSELAFEQLASAFDIRKAIQQKELQSMIQRILERMDLKYREVLILKYLEEKEYQEISFILKKPMGTIATLLNRAKKQFKQLCEKEGCEITFL